MEKLKSFVASAVILTMFMGHALPILAQENVVGNSLILSVVTASVVTSTSATITWTSNRASTTQVEYGASNKYGSSTILEASFKTSHTDTISNLSPNTLYHYRAISTDNMGNVTVSPDITFTTRPAGYVAPGSTTTETHPPVISVISVLTTSGISLSGATIAWRTNEISTSQVEYGLTRAYEFKTSIDATLKTDHSVKLENLSPGTVYYYRVRSGDHSGNEVVSGSNIFTTLPVEGIDTVAPVISNIVVQIIYWDKVLVTWHTNEPATEKVNYGKTTSYGSLTVLNSVLGTTHGALISSLSRKTTYNYKITSQDAKGNSTSSANLTFVTPDKKEAPIADTIAPVISTIAASKILTTAATISWLTNEIADTQVEYGLTTSYGKSTTLNPSFVTNHIVALGELLPNTTYNYRVKSKDGSGNLIISPNATFTTKALPPIDTTAPFISSVHTIDVTDSDAIVLWTTNEPADSQTVYGQTQLYGQSTMLNSALFKNHTQTLNQLKPVTTYHYSVKSRDEARNLATSTDYSFSTQPVFGPESVITHVAPPIISGITTANIVASGVTITWSTNEPTDTRVEYGSTISYGTSAAEEGVLTVDHGITLNDLSPSTTYHYRVTSKDIHGNVVRSEGHTFTTPSLPPPPVVEAPGDTVLPIISGLTPVVLTEDTVTIVWYTDEATKDEIQYGPTSNYGTTISLDGQFLTTHSYTITGLTSASEYHFMIKAIDENGNVAQSSDFIFTTTARPVVVDSPPIISDVQETPPPVVEPPVSTENPPTETPDETQIISPDPTPEVIPNPEPTPTPELAPTPTPSINIEHNNIQHSVATAGAVITWDTNEATIGQMEYGKDTSYGSAATDASLFSTHHSITLANLDYATTYHYRVVSVDASGNTAISMDYNFTTSEAPTSIAQPSDPITEVPQNTPDPSPVAPVESPSVPSSNTPEPVTDVHANDTDSQVALSWTDPVNGSTEVEIVRNADHAPTSPSDGQVVYNGGGGVFVDTNLVNGTSYSYGIFAKGGGGSVSVPVQLQVAPKEGVTQISLPAPVAPFVFTRNLKRGLSGDDVIYLQTFLSDQGLFPKDKIIGYFGPLTQATVIKFQKQYGITPVTGIAGPKTQAKINQLSSK